MFKAPTLISRLGTKVTGYSGCIWTRGAKCPEVNYVMHKSSSIRVEKYKLKSCMLDFAS